ncbi:hypothetical protein [Mesorhizobium carmichaelinearum]|uniref:hypothetical protein n=1 Tax=Mesorhizobium carmichaelinearum TaxID=1208188 RepID=UPI001FCE74E6|nr:hypothetical protein [Mesorhizobium carmichaelinearum]
MPENTAEIADTKAYGRSAVTNGSTLLPGVDGRSIWARRFRDLLGQHVADLGGEGAVSEAERSIARRATALEVELERLELRFATAGEAEAADLDLYSRASNTMRRHFEALGLQRRQRDITPSLRDQMRGAAS